MHETLQNVSCVLAVFSVHIGDEEQCGITQHIYYLLDIYWISTDYLLCTESPHFATSRSSAQFRKLSWVPWRLQYTTLSGEAVPLLAVVSDWHINILLASIICHLELEQGWRGVLQITNMLHVSFSSKLLPMRNGILSTRSLCSWLVLTRTWT